MSNVMDLDILKTCLATVPCPLKIFLVHLDKNVSFYNIHLKQKMPNLIFNCIPSKI